MPLSCKAAFGARAADYFYQFKRCIERVRCQNDVLAIDYVQAFGSVVLVVRTASELEKSHFETSPSFLVISSAILLSLRCAAAHIETYRCVLLNRTIVQERFFYGQDLPVFKMNS